MAVGSYGMQSKKIIKLGVCRVPSVTVLLIHIMHRRVFWPHFAFYGVGFASEVLIQNMNMCKSAVDSTGFGFVSVSSCEGATVGITYFASTPLEEVASGVKQSPEDLQSKV